jgi:hypothetical protein
MERPDYGRFPDLAAPDGGLPKASGSSLGPTPPVLQSFQGLSDDDNAAVVGSRIVPPDVNGDIGLDGSGNKVYLQYINLIWALYSDTGALLAGPLPGNSFWQGFGGFCQSNNDGDPVALYDDQAGRWVVSQFSINQGIQCVAVSTTSDPLGSYHRYAFTVTPGGQNDYPKMGVWDDGTNGSAGQSAYTFTLRDFGGAGGSFSVSAGVMERDQMLNGNPAQFVKFSNPCTGTDCIEGQLPPHLAGPPPPANTCPTYWTAVDAAYDDSPFANDGYRNHTLCVDWANTGNSTYTEGGLVVAGSNFDRFLGSGFSACISPVNGGEILDCLAGFTMYRAQYRWFGTEASVVLNTTVDAGSDRAGIRWAETLSANGQSGWTLGQDGTYAPADDNERWMGSIAQDQDRNIALGYSVTSPTRFPSVAYTSRMAGDPAGQMQGGEVICHEGTGAQTASSNRWGDYSSMSVDPVDDCTFWYTQEYYENTNSFDFKTRICSFRFEDCDPDPCTVDADCDDGNFCNGTETCGEDEFCDAGTYACADNPTWSCDEVADICVPECEVDADCDDGAFCNGVETCNAGTCDAGSDPCPGQACYEDGGVCADAAIYDPDLGALVCATAGSFCDSGTLVDGRASLGPEPNQPNTLDACADGTAGTYHSDESNDRIFVSTVDGEVFSEGSTVQIDATVWAWSTGSADTLDLYYAADANSPSWTYITSLAPPAGGAQTLSAQYVLPAGELQAVRAQFRYQSTNAPCSAGTYNDRDDLVFAVSGVSPECTIDADCDDGLFCNGAETCNAGICEAGTPPTCDDGLFCNGAETCNEGTDSCDAGTPPTCDDGAFCNGTESCNEGTDSCDAGTPPVCDDGTFCNGAETCNEGTDTCDAGTPPTCDDGAFCNGTESCNEGTDSCDAGTPPVCDDGIFCNGAEACDEGTDSCGAGTPPCGPDETCDEAADICEVAGCDFDGICEEGENCGSCPSDCISGTAGAVCGNGLCEAGDGENGVNCSADCNAKLNGNPANRFSCGLGGDYAVPCTDPRCTDDGFQCTEILVTPEPYCCGDAMCGGAEDSFSCALDCGDPPACVPTHDKEKGPRCSDGLDNDCDGAIDGADPDC